MELSQDLLDYLTGANTSVTSYPAQTLSSVGITGGTFSYNQNTGMLDGPISTLFPSNVGTAADGHDVQFQITSGGASAYYIGAVTFLDTDNEVSVIAPNGSSNDFLNVHVPFHFDITFTGVAASNVSYAVTGTVTSATAPPFHPLLSLITSVFLYECLNVSLKTILLLPK